jgi:hypothetical protein
MPAWLLFIKIMVNGVLTDYRYFCSGRLGDEVMNLLDFQVTSMIQQRHHPIRWIF